MIDRQSNIELTIILKERDLDEEELMEHTLTLLRQMRELDEVETVNLADDPNPPEGCRAVGGFLVGVLKAEVSVANFKKLMGFLGDRLASKPIKLKVKKPNGAEIELEASNQEKFEFAMQKAQEFLNNP